jgi:hypothetical protein
MGKIALRKNRNNMTQQLIYLAIILKVNFFAYISKYRSIKKYQICTEGIFHTVLSVLP